jgi:hypothetical protein
MLTPQEIIKPFSLQVLIELAPKKGDFVSNKNISDLLRREFSIAERGFTEQDINHYTGRIAQYLCDTNKIKDFQGSAGYYKRL